MSLVDTLRKDMFEAKRNGDDKSSSILSIVLADISNAKISKGDELSEEEVIDVVRKEAKKLKEAFELYTSSGRNDLAEVEKFQLDVIERYLPKLMSEEEIKAFVQDKIAELSLPVNDLGKLMGLIMPQLKGKADGALVNKVVREIASN